MSYGPYSVAWVDWNLEERLRVLERIGCTYENGMFYHEYELSSGQKEVFEFLRDPTYPIAMWKLDIGLGKQTLKLFNEFWSWRFRD